MVRNEFCMPASTNRFEASYTHIRRSFSQLIAYSTYKMALKIQFIKTNMDDNGHKKLPKMARIISEKPDFKNQLSTFLNLFDFT